MINKTFLNNQSIEYHGQKALQIKSEVYFLQIEGIQQTSGNWEVNCADYCNITSNVEVGGNSIILSGIGYFNVQSNITADLIAYTPTCKILNVPGDGNELRIAS